MGIIPVYGDNPNFVCHVQMSKYMYEKPRHLFIEKLNFENFSHLQKYIYF